MIRSVKSFFQTTPSTFTGGTSVNLVRAAHFLIEFLDRVHQYPCLYTNEDVLKRALNRYETIWLPLLASVVPHQRIALIPPIDVHWVWFCHMLCPHRYVTDSPLMCSAAGFHPHHNQSQLLDHALFSRADYRRGVRCTQRIWALYTQNQTEPYDLHDYLQQAPLVQRASSSSPSKQSNISYNVIAAASRQMAFHYQAAILPHYRHISFMQVAVARYSKFLQLMRDFPDQIWVPTYDIDIVWHAHMLHPRLYVNDTERMCKQLIRHDDTLNDRSDGSDYSQFWHNTCTTWKKQFGESLLIPGGVWRGNVSIQELDLRALSNRLVCDAGKRIISRQQRRSGIISFRGRSVVSFKSLATTPKFSDEGRRRWNHVKWLHSQNYRSATNGGNCDGRENGAVERWSIVQSAAADGGEKMLSCRVVLPRSCFHRKRDVCTQCTFMEIFSNSTHETSWIPLCTAQFVPHLGVCIGEGVNRHLCTRMPEEQMMLIRMCGEDYALLGARWVNAARAERLSRRRPYLDDGDQQSKRMALRLWLLAKGTADRWIDLAESGNGNREGLTYKVSTGEDRSATEVTFDLKTALVTLLIREGDKQNIGHALVSSQAIATSAALLLGELRSNDDRFDVTSNVGGGEMVALVGGGLMTAQRVEEC